MALIKACSANKNPHKKTMYSMIYVVKSYHYQIIKICFNFNCEAILEVFYKNIFNGSMGCMNGVVYFQHL